MMFTCAHCGCRADRELPPPPPDITVIYICHDCAWEIEEGDEDPTTLDYQARWQYGDEKGRCI